jgi:flavorubredoxin
VITLHETGNGKNVMFHELCSGEMVQANQHLIASGSDAMLLDPGGHKVFSKLFADVAGAIHPATLKLIFFSHQDPDIVAAANGWLMATEAKALAPSLWMRFIPHFGVDEYAVKRMTGIPDAGTSVTVGTKKLEIIPAHFLHSAGNFHVYDPEARILYSGDMGASIGMSYTFVEDFDSHLEFMAGFHRRYMASNRAMRHWVSRVRSLPIETLAPQHGAIFRGQALVERFLDWAEGLACGVDLLDQPER